MSSIGVVTAWSPSRPPGRTSVTPPRARLTSKLVPPMSIVIAFGSSSGATAAALAIGPPAGPDSSVETACSATTSGLATPPLDCITSSEPSKWSCVSRLRRFVR